MAINVRFYQRNWNLIKGDVISAINSFFESGKLLKKINHSFLALVLKSNDASSLSEYRPISCHNVLYKLVTKVLSKRLELVKGKLISANQNAFLRGRQISDNTLSAHELVTDFEKKIRK